MPRTSTGPRLVLYGPDKRYSAKAKAGFKDYVWYIVWHEGGKKRERSTGAGVANRGDAEAALAEWIADRASDWAGTRRPDQISIADVLDVYGREHAPHVV